MFFTDLHIHILCGVDDGAKTEADMYAMTDAVYAGGTRILCATPHFHPGYFGDNIKESEEAFARLSAYVSEKYPQMKLYLGNELRYSKDCVSWLEQGACRTINGTSFVLVDFSEREEKRNIVRGLENLLNAGYTPILAHVERYNDFGRDFRTLADLRANGVVLQIDAQSVTRGFGLSTQYRCRKLLEKSLVDIVSTDAHNLSTRPPDMMKCYAYIKKQHGTDYARAVCLENAEHILTDNTVGKDMD